MDEWRYETERWDHVNNTYILTTWGTVYHSSFLSLLCLINLKGEYEVCQINRNLLLTKKLQNILVIADTEHIDYLSGVVMDSI